MENTSSLEYSEQARLWRTYGALGYVSGGYDAQRFFMAGSK